MAIQRSFLGIQDTYKRGCVLSICWGLHLQPLPGLRSHWVEGAGRNEHLQKTGASPPCDVCLYIPLRPPRTPVSGLQRLSKNPQHTEPLLLPGFYLCFAHSRETWIKWHSVHSETQLACLLHSQRVKKEDIFPKTPEETVAKGQAGELSGGSVHCQIKVEILPAPRCTCYHTTQNKEKAIGWTGDAL